MTPKDNLSRNPVTRQYFQILRDNIGVETSFRDWKTLGITSLLPSPSDIEVSVNLAQQYLRAKKKTLLIDLSGRVSGLNQYYPLIQTNTGFTDLCYHLFENDLSNELIENYGFWDILYACYLKELHCVLRFATKNNETYEIEIFSGRPVAIHSQQSLFEKTLFTNALNLNAISKEKLQQIFSGKKLDQLGTLKAFFESKILADNQFFLIYQKTLKETLFAIAEKELASFEVEKQDPIKQEIYTYLPDGFLPFKNLLGPKHYFSQKIDSYLCVEENGLAILPFGNRQPHQNEFPKHLGKLLSLLKEKFDVILFHCPPALEKQINWALLNLLDHVLLIVPEDKTEPSELKATVKQLKKRKVNLVGMVITGISDQAYFEFD